MKISEVIQHVKDYSRGIAGDNNEKIDDAKTRDQVLYGDTDKECTGIVTTCFASVDVIKETHKLGANLIIPHEALFWNHGDHTDWLEKDNNKIFFEKKALLDEYGITVWRNHDYIHSGVKDGKGGYYDGIFKGFAHYTGLEDYYVPQVGSPVMYQGENMFRFEEGITVKELAEKIMDGCNLRGVRVIGKLDDVVHTAMIPGHIMSFRDNQIISKVDAKDVDCLLCMELIDFTVNEYMRDGEQLGHPKAMIVTGHFNTEEPGMKYMMNWLPDALGTKDIPMTFVASGDMNHFIVK